MQTHAGIRIYGTLIADKRATCTCRELQEHAVLSANAETGRNVDRIDRVGELCALCIVDAAS